MAACHLEPGGLLLYDLLLVRDRETLTSARIENPPRGGPRWISALRGPATRSLALEGTLQLGLSDERNLAEIENPELRGERMVVCRNPAPAAGRSRKGMRCAADWRGLSRPFSLSSRRFSQSPAANGSEMARHTAMSSRRPRFVAVGGARGC